MKTEFWIVVVYVMHFLRGFYSLSANGSRSPTHKSDKMNEVKTIDNNNKLLIYNLALAFMD